MVGNKISYIAVLNNLEINAYARMEYVLLKLGCRNKLYYYFFLSKLFNINILKIALILINKPLITDLILILCIYSYNLLK